ncbi:MAG: septal ring lytic transglycosylase RlpA family protein [Gammaproteobacteria bacterium]|nr:septal ring lytic transglycosylase RlpA family protein [Gammaproteobacteria bacterium]
MKVINKLVLVIPLLLLGIVTGCTTTGPRDGAPNIKSIDLDGIPNAVPRNEPLSRYGNPVKYALRGKTYYVRESSEGYIKRGKASWYGTKFQGRLTSSRVPYDMFKMTAAHKTLPLPSYVEVENLDNGKKIIVKVNDRGPFHAGRIIDLSYVAALKLGIVKTGTGNVEVRAITPRKTNLAKSDLSESAPVFVQVGAFSDMENAERMQIKLAQSEITSDIHKLVINAHKHIYRVRVGPLKKQDEVGKLLGDLESIGVADAKVFTDNGE